MNTKTLEQLDLKGKKVLVRADLDVPIAGGNITDVTRLETLLPTLNYICDKGAKQIILVGHMGRPQGKKVDSLSLKPLENYFRHHFTPEICFVDYQPYDLFYQVTEEISKCDKRLVILENLRFWPQEESNNEEFAKQLAYSAEAFVNESFAASHRSHASLVGIPKVLPSAGGRRFIKEVENLSKVFQKPVLAIISGLKKDKLQYLEGFKKFCDKILLGGRLPEFVNEDLDDPKVLVARLNPDKEDITIHSIEKFEEEIASAGTIILAGPIWSSSYILCL